MGGGDIPHPSHLIHPSSELIMIGLFHLVMDSEYPQLWACPKKMFRKVWRNLSGSCTQPPLPQAREEEARQGCCFIQVPDHAKYAAAAMVVSIVGIIVEHMLVCLPRRRSLLGSIEFRWDGNARELQQGQHCRASVILGTVAVIAAYCWCQYIFVSFLNDRRGDDMNEEMMVGHHSIAGGGNPLDVTLPDLCWMFAGLLIAGGAVVYC